MSHLTKRWSGSFDSTWDLLPLKYGFRLIGSGTTPQSDKLEYYGGDTPWVTTSELRENRITSTFESVTPLAIDEYTSLKLYEPDTILFAMYGATIGRVATLGIRACVNQAVCALSQPSHFDPAFAVYCFQASRDYLISISSGGGQPNLNAEKVKEHTFPCPPLETQRQIAAYLDRETGRIDALIAAKERLLSLLAEKRQSLITHSVTRGLNPNVPLRDSGIPWLGEIPEHWIVHRLKFHMPRIEQGWSPQCDNFPANDDEWGVLKVGAVNGWEFNPDENKRLPDDLEPLVEYEVHEGDVLMSRANTTQLLGRAALVRNVRPKLIFCDKHYRLTLDLDVLNSEFVVLYLRSTSGHFEFERDATGASNSMQNIGQDSVQNVWITVPPISEQNEIVRYITDSTVRMDATEAANQRTLDLLRERRAALIAAAVTGQVDVGA